MQSQWKGSRPQRFVGGIKTYERQNQLASGFSFSTNSSSIPHNMGIRAFSPSLSQQQQYRPHMRIFDHHYSPITSHKQIDYGGIKPVSLPPQTQRTRAQKVHVRGGMQTLDQQHLRGIRAYDQANRSRDKVYYVQHQMQRKCRVQHHDKLRNSIGLNLLQDTPTRMPYFTKNSHHMANWMSDFVNRSKSRDLSNSQIFTKAGSKQLSRYDF